MVLLFVQPLWIFDGIDAVSYQKEIWRICEVYNEELLNTTCKTLDLRELEEVADVCRFAVFLAYIKGQWSRLYV
jgi:hypothetical protein